MKRIAYISANLSDAFAQQVENSSICINDFIGTPSIAEVQSYFDENLEKSNIFDRGGKYTSTRAYITFNGINYDFGYIETMLSQLRGLNPVKETTSGAIDYFNQFAELLKDKVITFDFHVSYRKDFDNFIVPLAKQNYGITNFTSTNGSSRAMAVLKF